MTLSDEERAIKLEYGSSEAKSTLETRQANMKIKTPKINSYKLGRTFSKMTRTLDQVFSSNRVSDLSSIPAKEPETDVILSKKILVETNSFDVRRRRNLSKLSVDKNSMIKKNIENIK